MDSVSVKTVGSGFTTTYRLAFSVLIAALVMLIPALPLKADATSADLRPPIRLGVLSYRANRIASERWQPTADYLQHSLPQFHVELLLLRHHELEAAVKNRAVDFVLTHPDQYIKLHATDALRAIATLTPVTDGNPLSQFGGVIFTRADQGSIKTLQDLPGTTLVTARQDALGVYIAQQWTLSEANLDAKTIFASQLFIGPPQELTVESVMAGEADVGFVRTGVLENLANEGLLSLQNIRVINPRSELGFPLLLSTDLYPEWPLAALPHVEPSVSNAVALHLQWMTKNSFDAPGRNGYSFVPPLDYSAVDAVMLKLNIHPRSGDLARQKLIDDLLVWTVLALGIGIVTLLIFSARVKRLNKALQHSIQNLQLRDSMLERLGDGVYCMDNQGKTAYINPAALKMLGFSEEEVMASNTHQLFHHTRADGHHYPLTDCPVFKTLQDSHERQVEDRFYRKDGSSFPVEINASAIKHAGRVHSAVVVFRDISERREMMNQINYQRGLLQSVIDATSDLIFYKDSAGIYLGCNRAFRQIAGAAHNDQVVGKKDSELFDQQLAAEFERTDNQILKHRLVEKHEAWISYPDGRRVLFETLKTPLYDKENQVTGLVGISRDITLRKQAEDDIAKLAFFDSLTQLPNRRLLMDRIKTSLNTSKRNGEQGAVLMIDLDNFKVVNDTEGHDAGDQVLRETAKRLTLSVRSMDTVARLGGDEFMVVLSGLGQGRAAAAVHIVTIANKILDNLSQPHSINTSNYVTTPSIGITFFDAASPPASTLMKQADKAMYLAKENGRNGYAIYYEGDAYEQRKNATRAQKRPEKTA